MTRFITIALSVLFITAFGSPGVATAAEWSVVRASGEVVIQIAGAQPASLTNGETLPPGGVLRTGANARAVLVRAQEQMIVGPNSVVALPPGPEDRQFTTIVQAAGVVEFSVEKRNVKHFAVTTPQLAAVVKGTHFVVGAFNSGGVVKVASGRVEVTALQSGQVTDVTANQEAVIHPGGTLTLSGSGPFADILQGASPLDGSSAAGGTQAANGVGGVAIGDDTVSLANGILTVMTGNGNAGATVGNGLASVTAGNDGASVNVGDVVSLNAGSGVAGVNANGVVSVNAGKNGVTVQVHGVQLGPLGH